jgi:hypothetical protein
MDVHIKFSELIFVWVQFLFLYLQHSFVKISAFCSIHSYLPGTVLFTIHSVSLEKEMLSIYINDGTVALGGLVVAC